MLQLKKRLASVILAGSIMGVTAMGAVAAPPATNGPQTAAADAVVSQLMSLVAQGGLINVNDLTAQVGLVNVSKSLNSVQILNNVLNNSPILNNNEILKNITLTDVNVLSIDESTVLNNFLNDNNIAINDVVSVAVLSGGDLIVFTR